MTERVRVGLVGAGPWSHAFSAPMLSRADDVDFAGTWARRFEAAEELAEAFGTRPVADLDELAASVDALVFAVPPAVQAELASRLATSGVAMLLEKPVALSVHDADALCEVLERHSVPTQVVFTFRYLRAMRRLMSDLGRIEPHGARAAFVGGGVVEGLPFATPWRLEHGALPDLGPHVLDALVAALGPIVEIQAAGDPLGSVHLLCRHAGGRNSTAVVSVTTPGEPSGLQLEVYGRTDRRSFSVDWGDPVAGPSLFEEAQRCIVDEFVTTVRTRRSHDLDVRHGCAIQHLLAQAGRAL
jgi:predicted dehydrogenase